MSRNYLVTPRATIYTGAALVAALGLFAMPAHAAEPANPTNSTNPISITVEQVANLTPQDDLYKATTNIMVKSSESNGFSLTMAADKPDLVNSTDGKYKITAVKSGEPSTLSTNQWGYSLDQSSDKYSQVPTASAPLRLVNVTPNTLDGCKSATECTKSVTFAANIDNTTLPAGRYSTQVVYTVTPKLAPKPPVVSKSICRAGAADNDCKVDIDPDMVPVKYTGSTTDAQWTSIANPEDVNSGWYDYANKQWANAVTVKKEAYAKYKDKNAVVDPADILGHWVYIPRYAYEVMRRDHTDKLVKEQNFNIHFEKATDPKRIPAVCASKGVDYRTECDLNRDYINGQPSSQGTWATHPAFTFGKKELNGIWFAKFQTTGDLKQPTVLPNQKYLSGSANNVKYNLAQLFADAKSLGVADAANVAGGTPLAAQNSHNLARYSSRMINNNDWGAAAYLSASQYGAGFDKVEPNNQSGLKYRKKVENKKRHKEVTVTVTDDYGITGCGAMRGKNGKFKDNKDGGKVGTQSACSSLDPQLAYNGTTGQLASTTNNPTGIYDMAGGGREVVAAAYSDDPDHMVAKSEYENAVFDTKPPYTNLYHFTYMNSYECTWETCGGQALHEVEYNYGAYLSACGLKLGNMWNVTSGVLAGGCNASYKLWFTRGGGKGGLSLFYAGAYDGKVDNQYSFRVVLGDFRQ